MDYYNKYIKYKKKYINYKKYLLHGGSTTTSPLVWNIYDNDNDKEKLKTINNNNLVLYNRNVTTQDRRNVTVEAINGNPTNLINLIKLINNTPFITKDNNKATNYTNYKFVPINNIFTYMNPTHANDVKEKINEFNDTKNNNKVFETTIPLNTNITLNKITQISGDTIENVKCDRLFILNKQLVEGTNEITIRIMTLSSKNPYHPTKCHGADVYSQSEPEPEPKPADKPATSDTGSDDFHNPFAPS